MPIYFNSAPTDFPFQFDSIGNNWNQEPTLRPDGFPVYHYLQTQEGSGILSIAVSYTHLTLPTKLEV